MAGGENQTRPVSGTAKRCSLATRAGLGDFEIDARERRAYGFAQRLDMKSEIPCNRMNALDVGDGFVSEVEPDYSNQLPVDSAWKMKTGNSPGPCKPFFMKDMYPSKISFGYF
jgi:hypothetical protein